ncbi:MAG: polysulfide reductase NrfD [Anaerolineales bacterium]
MNEQKSSVKILWAIAGLAFVVGLYGLYDRFAFGHMNTGYGSYVPWGLWIAAYTMLVGASAGAFATSAVALISGKDEWIKFARFGLLVALGAFAAGMLNVLLDLGHPERILRLYFANNPFSMMGLMAWFYLLYGLLLVFMIWKVWSGQIDGLLSKLAYLSVPFAILFAGAEGALFGVVGARPLWESGLTPAMFLLEGALSGLSLVLLANWIVGWLNADQSRFLGRVLLSLLAVLVIFEWAEYSTGLYAGIPAKVNVMRNILFGPYWWVFWLVHIVAGVVLPLLLLFFQPDNAKTTALAAGLVALTAIAAKLNLVIPVLASPELQGLERAYSGPGLVFDYFPTMPEWILFVWTVSLAALIFLAGYQFLPKMLKNEVK